MAVPKRKTSRTRRDKRRSHDFLTAPNNLISCPNKACGQKMEPHRVCPSCGQYKGEQITAIK